MQRNQRKKGIARTFSLVEILVVVAIIGVLASVLLPVGSMAIERAQRVSDSQHLKQIAITYFSLLNDSSKVHGRTLHEAVGSIAEQSPLKETALWVSKVDRHVQSHLPKYLLLYNQSNQSYDLHYDVSHSPLSVTIANGIRSSAAASTTPVAWTRGLQEDGYWSKELGVYGDKGGYIAFLDGHVEWFDNLAKDGGMLLHYAELRPTCNIKEALPFGACVLDSCGLIKSRKN